MIFWEDLPLLLSAAPAACLWMVLACSDHSHPLRVPTVPNMAAIGGCIRGIWTSSTLRGWIIEGQTRPMMMKTHLICTDPHTSWCKELMLMQVYYRQEDHICSASRLCEKLLFNSSHRVLTTFEASDGQSVGFTNVFVIVIVVEYIESSNLFPIDIFVYNIYS